jgi:predicted Zn-dependent peptidase
MRKAFLLALLLIAARPQDSGFKLPLKDFTLPNGMRILVLERHDVPRVFCSLWWRVGSVYERPGVTGLSHFFEHMMFMGTDVIGTTDPRKDAELNASIERVMGQIRVIKLARLEAQRRGAAPDPDLEARYKELQKDYKGLVEEQKKIIIPEHLSKIFQAHGGTGLNATTSYDRTNFFVDMPANKVELFCWLESDRFLKPVFRSFYPEREVVKEERRMRTDSTPTGLIHEAFNAMFWEAHPYQWPVIGWMSDIDEYTMADAERYYKTHYSPQNCTAIFVGDVKLDEIRELCTRYFGRLQRSSVERDAIVTVEPEQVAERRMNAQANAQDNLTIRWHGPSGVHKDSAALDLLMNVFSGRSGRLYRPLVEEKKLALEVSAGYESRRYGGLIEIDATPREGADVASLEKEIEAIVEDVRSNGVKDRELEKARNQQMADLVRMLKTNQGVTHQLGYFETIGTYADFDAYVHHVETATVADLKHCAEEYLKPTGRNILVIKRKAQAVERKGQK